MIKLVVKIFLIIIGIAVLAVWTVPKYKETTSLLADKAKYEKALLDSKELLSVKKELGDKYSAIDQVTIDKLTKLLPDNVDNIRLILEISKVGEKYGMVIKNVKFDTFNQSTTTNVDPNSAQTNDQVLEADKPYGSFSLEFSVEGTYPNFVKFVADVEKSLRIVDISNITFSSVDTKSANPTGVTPSKSSDINKYDFKITTYWLKN